MLPKTLQAYIEAGYSVFVGNNRRVCSAVTHAGQVLETGGGMSISDIAFFLGLSRLWQPSGIFIVGNAFGYSTCLLAEIFSQAIVDVIDAEIEGSWNINGTALTRRIAAKYFPNIQVTQGFSPQDLTQAMRLPAYDLIFIDGLHTNEQLLQDFIGLLPHAASQSVFYLHDVIVLKMETAYKKIRAIGANGGYKSYDIDFTSLGCKALVRDLPPIEQWLQQIQCPIAHLKQPEVFLG